MNGARDAATDRFSSSASALSESVTHGTKALADSLNAGNRSRPILDLGIGALDQPTDARIADAVGEALRCEPQLLHAFSPVRGHEFLRRAISERIERLHRLATDPMREVLVTPGGVKGALTVAFHTFLDPGDEVVVPIPNWPHYMDMIRLHRGIARPVLPSGGLRSGLTPEDLEAHLSRATRLVILGDCINPTGKVYSSEELEALAAAIARHNADRAATGSPRVNVVLDSPYEAHVQAPRPVHFAAIDVDLPSGRHSMRDCTVYVSGPGKTYGMHGDRLGYLIATPRVLEIASNVQANTNSFASTYAQVACHRALQEDMDEVVEGRVRSARSSLEMVARRLAAIDGLGVEIPDGAYFLFVDFSAQASRYAMRGHGSAASFLLQLAGVATIDGSRFAEGVPGMEHWVRINCGRSPATLEQACSRIEQALQGLGA